MNVVEFGDRFNLSSEAMTAIRNELKTQGAAVERFQFDTQEFNSEIGYRSIELSNGGILTAQSSDLIACFIKSLSIRRIGLFAYRPKVR